MMTLWKKANLSQAENGWTYSFDEIQRLEKLIRDDDWEAPTAEVVEIIMREADRLAATRPAPKADPLGDGQDYGVTGEWWGSAKANSALVGELRALDAILRFHETGGHSGDGSDAALAKAQTALTKLSLAALSDSDVVLEEAAKVAENDDYYPSEGAFIAERIRALKGGVDE